MNDVVNVVTDFINGVGFPVFVACYSLFKLNKTIESNTEILIKLSEKLQLDESEV